MSEDRCQCGVRAFRDDEASIAKMHGGKVAQLHRRERDGECLLTREAVVNAEIAEVMAQRERLRGERDAALKRAEAAERSRDWWKDEHHALDRNWEALADKLSRERGQARAALAAYRSETRDHLTAAHATMRRVQSGVAVLADKLREAGQAGLAHEAECLAAELGEG